MNTPIDFNKKLSDARQRQSRVKLDTIFMPPWFQTLVLEMGVFLNKLNHAPAGHTPIDGMDILEESDEINTTYTFQVENLRAFSVSLPSAIDVAAIDQANIDIAADFLKHEAAAKRKEIISDFILGNLDNILLQYIETQHLQTDSAPIEVSTLLMASTKLIGGLLGSTFPNAPSVSDIGDERNIVLSNGVRMTIFPDTLRPPKPT